MGGRRALVIGAQCLSYNLLSFLPAAAQEMAAALNGIMWRYHGALYLRESDVDGVREEFEALLPISTRVLGEHHEQTRRIAAQLG
jgi:hypothetical protein